MTNGTEPGFDGKRCVVTGATSGIGRATALKLARAGARIAAIARDEKALAELKRATGASGGGVTTIRADLALAADRRRATTEARAALGGVDVLVNAAGILERGTLADTKSADFDRTMEINLKAPFELMQLLLEDLAASKGAVVNVSSVAGPRAFPGVLAYCVSKAAVDQLTRCAALELGPRGVRVNAVCPGVVVTELHKRGGMSADEYAGFLERSKTTHPLGRTGTAEEVADLILFLASDRAGWITGGTYPIDGGRGETCAR